MSECWVDLGEVAFVGLGAVRISHGHPPDYYSVSIEFKRMLGVASTAASESTSFVTGTRWKAITHSFAPTVPG